MSLPCAGGAPLLPDEVMSCASRATHKAQQLLTAMHAALDAARKEEAAAIARAHVPQGAASGSGTAAVAVE
jgi:hypothetical protein